MLEIEEHSGCSPSSAGHWHAWQTALHNPNFADYATNCGTWDKRVTDKSELDATLAEALGQPGPALIKS